MIIIGINMLLSIINLIILGVITIPSLVETKINLDKIKEEIDKELNY